jgi:flagellar hook-associated protein 3 FlgL
MALDAALIDPVAGFGFPADSPQVAQLTTQRIAEFIDGSFADLFSEASWKSQWSSASDAVLENRISLHQTIDASMSANDPALRKIAMAYVMVSELGISGMTNDGARTLIRKATATLDEGMALLKTSRARVGVMQQSIEIADENLQSYSDMLEIEATRLGAVDRSETATRINEVLTRIETAYALTARISQLSLTRYI